MPKTPPVDTEAYTHACLASSHGVLLRLDAAGGVRVACGAGVQPAGASGLGGAPPPSLPL